MMTKRKKPVFVVVLLLLAACGISQRAVLNFYPANHHFIQYTGRVDFNNPKLPRFWQPGVYISLRFKGDFCAIILQDEILWGKNHNYLEIVIDGKPKRIQTKSKRDTIQLEKLDNFAHSLVIV